MRIIIKITVLTILGCLGILLSCRPKQENREIKLVVVFQNQARDTLNLCLSYYYIRDWGRLYIKSASRLDADCIAENVKYVKELR